MVTNNSINVGTGTASGQILQSTGAGNAPDFSTATYPDTTTANQILYSSATNVVGEITTANDGILVTDNTGIPSILAGPGASGKVLQSNAAAAPSYSTPTYPSASGTSGKVLVSDGTNIVYSTPTFPNSSATAGKFIRSDGTNWIASTPTLPTSAGTAGKVLMSNATNYVESTPTYPSTSGTSRKILVSDGTNIVYSTETWAVPGTSGNVLTSDGTNWTSAAPSGGTKPNFIYNYKASDFDVLETNFAPLVQNNGTNVNNLVRSFVNGTETFVNFSILVPSDINTGGNATLRFNIYAATAAASKNIAFKFYYKALSDSAAWDAAYSSSTSADIAIDATQGDVTISSYTISLATLGWTANQYVLCKLSRVAASANDLASSMYLINWSIELPRS